MSTLLSPLPSTSTKDLLCLCHPRSFLSLSAHEQATASFLLHSLPHPILGFLQVFTFHLIGVKSHTGNQSFLLTVTGFML
jgi:hypothetical protein